MGHQLYKINKIRGACGALNKNLEPFYHLSPACGMNIKLEFGLKILGAL